VATNYESIEGWFDFDDIYELALRRCGTRAATFCEVGAYLGRSTCYMAERIRETGRDVSLHVVDTFEGDVHVGRRDLWPDFAANMARAGVLAALNVHRRTSAEAASELRDDSLDFVFVDAEHTHDAVTRDLAAWWPKVRPGGLLAGHDYAHFEGVTAAVDEFVANRGLRRVFRTSRSSWLIYKSITVDAAYCVNLAHREDRRRSATAQFRSAGIADRVRFFSAVDGRTLDHPGVVSPGQAGCAASHLAVLREAASRGARHLLVFEDDVVLVPDFRGRLEGALARCPASYDVFYIGALCVRQWGNYLHPVDDIMARAGHVLGSHAYVVNTDLAPDVQASLGKLTRIVDHYFAQDVQPRGNAYVSVPYLASQTNGHSDISGAYTDPRGFAQYVWR
jgi:predicted O-methyltransferase YrrM